MSERFGCAESLGGIAPDHGELMANLPNEAQKSKDALFDHHCALDFFVERRQIWRAP
jgi:hypothetical protein